MTQANHVTDAEIKLKQNYKSDSIIELNKVLYVKSGMLILFVLYNTIMTQIKSDRIYIHNYLEIY